MATAQSTASARETQEAKIEQGLRDLNDLRIDLINYYLAGSLKDTIYDYGDSTVALLETETDEFSIKQLVSIYVSRGDTVLTAQKLALLDNTNAENAQFINLMNVLNNLKKVNKKVFQLTSSQVQTVRDVASSSTTTSYYAKAILGLVFNEFTIERPVLTPSGSGKRGDKLMIVPESSNSISNINFLSVYPNPASTIVTVDYLLLKPYKTAKIVVTSTTGATFKTIDLKQMSGKYELDLQMLNSGVYFIELRADNELISVKKLIVNK